MSIFQLVSVAEETGFNLTLSDTHKDRFSRDEAQMTVAGDNCIAMTKVMLQMRATVYSECGDYIAMPKVMPPMTATVYSECGDCTAVLLNSK